MNFRIFHRSLALLAIANAITLPAHASCGSAFCSINTDLASQALGIGEGSVFDLRYEYINQDQPRTGSKKLRVGEIPHHHDEVRTRNQNLLATYSRGFASGWGYSVVAPVVDRFHTHIHNHHGAKLDQEWSFRELGDIRLTGRYQTAVGGHEEAPRTAGVIFGVKLPTGRTSVANASGDVAERSLQPGTGTTDAVVGAFLHQQLTGQSASWFASAQYQHPLNSHDNFRPGAQLTADLGYARRLGERLAGIVQLNAAVKQRDRGTEAEPDDSGSRSLFLSPGLSYDLTDKTRAYAFYQHPLHQHVNGVQLTARRAIVVGVSMHF
jgi:hypothetical protein